MLHRKKTCLKAKATLRNTVQIDGDTKFGPLITVYSILCIIDSSLWHSFVRIGSENKAAENPTSSKKLIRIALRLPLWASVLEKFNEMKIGTVIEYHINELFEFSLVQIINQNLTTGNQQRPTIECKF